jgi:hypothetical protein
VLNRHADYSKNFVKVWAPDGLARLAEADPCLTPIVVRLLKRFERSDSACLRSRAGQIRDWWGRSGAADCAIKNQSLSRKLHGSGPACIDRLPSRDALCA